jgi:hypothetical protein
MSLGWRTLLPVATVNLIVVAAFLLLQELYGGGVALIVSVAAFAALYVLFRAVTNTRTTETAKKEEFLPSRTVRMVELNAPKASSGTSNSSEEPVEASVA